MSVNKLSGYIGLKRLFTTTELDITVGLITAGFVRIGSDVSSLPVLNLKMRK
jgi:hypothetical protein